jgi:chaperonin GroEL
MLRRASEKLGNEFGDGTSTVTCMTQSLVNSGRELIEKKGLNTRQLVYELEQKKGLVLEALRHQRKQLDNDIRPEHIVLTSTNNDTEITNTIMEAYKAVGEEGLILMEESKSVDTLVQLSSGYSYDKGYISSQFIKDNASLSINMTDVRFLFCDVKIERTEHIKDIILQIGMANRANSTNTSLVIIAEDFDPQVLAMLIMTNRNYNGVPICCIKAPSYGENRFFMLEDMAALTSGTVISQNNGLSIGDLRYEDLGSAGSIYISAEEFIIKEPNIDEARVNKRIEHANAQYHNDTDILWAREQARKRMAKLMSKTAIVLVGGTSDLDVKEKMDRYDDAIKALMVSLRGGIVAGGGVAMLNSRLPEKENDWASTILNKALYAPFKQIMDNAGVMPKERQSVLESIKQGKYYTLKMKGNMGQPTDSNLKFLSPFLAVSDSLKATQCIDPYLVTEACINTSVAIATSILLTAGIIQSEIALSEQHMETSREIDEING